MLGHWGAWLCDIIAWAKASRHPHFSPAELGTFVSCIFLFFQQKLLMMSVALKLSSQVLAGEESWEAVWK